MTRTIMRVCRSWRWAKEIAAQHGCINCRDRPARVSVIGGGVGTNVLQKSEREKPHCGETTQHAPTQTPCNQPAIAIVTHDPVHTHRTGQCSP